jgi:hypothetical protein
MAEYRLYQLDAADHIVAGYNVHCISIAPPWPPHAGSPNAPQRWRYGRTPAASAASEIPPAEHSLVQKASGRWKPGPTHSGNRSNLIDHGAPIA